MKNATEKKKYSLLKRGFIAAITLTLLQSVVFPSAADSGNASIKWVDFDISADALTDAMEADIASHETAMPISWIELLSALACRYGGNFSSYKKADLAKLLEAYKSGSAFLTLSGNEKLYRYYLKAYGAVLGGMLGEYTEITSDGTASEGYGLIAFSPIAQGYAYNHYDDFGASRSYGYKRRHLGHDMMGSVGTPIVAVEAGYVEACGWNQYGGWRIGIRSFDGERYYYYAHLRKNHPYCDIYEGKIVDAGEVIGYLGMTGYSAKENTNNINVPHLHIGLQLIFDPSQKDGYNQIWIDMYELTKFLARNKSKVTKTDGGEYCADVVRIPRDTRD